MPPIPPPVAGLLRAVAFDDEVPPQQLPAVLADQLVAGAAWHGITSLLRHSPVRRALPDPTALERAYAYEQAVRLQVLADLESVALALSGMPWAVVKGPVLSEVVYARKGRRGFVDLDVLVHPRDFGAALTGLDAVGAQLVDQNFTLARRQGRAELTLLLPGGTSLDLHWHVINDPSARASFRLDTGGLLERGVPARLGATDAWRLSAADVLLHVLVHAALSGGHRLIWIRDIREAAVHVDADEFCSAAEKAGCVLPAGVMLRRAGVPWPWVQPPGARAWAAVARRVSDRAPLGRMPGEGRSGRLIMSLTRRTSAASAGAAVAYRLSRRTWQRRVKPAELSQPVSGAARAEYLTWAASGGV